MRYCINFLLSAFIFQAFVAISNAVVSNTTLALTASTSLSISSPTDVSFASGDPLSTIVVSGTTYAPVTLTEYVSGSTVFSTVNNYVIITENATVSGTFTSWTATINIGVYGTRTPDVRTLTQTVPAYVVQTLQGADLPSGKYLILTGPTTFTTTATILPNEAGYFYDVKAPSSATQCYPISAYIETGTARQVTYAMQQVYTTASNAPPETIWVTSTELLGPEYGKSPHGMEPGQYCGGVCGFCELFYPDVSVFYWPVPSPNTACLTSTASAQSSLNARALYASPRGLPGNDSILVSDGFTFTSPSAYIVFPTISAANACGQLGAVHTSVTYPIAPGELSSIVGYSSYSFDFADALCPPASLYNVDHISMIGKGYRPIIAPIDALTSLDHDWGYNCAVAPFQGNDPPFALTPAANLAPFTTKSEAPLETTPASPSSTIGSVPIQTPQPILSPIISSSQPESTVVNDPKSASGGSPNPIQQSSSDPPAAPSSSKLLSIPSLATPTPSAAAVPGSNNPSSNLDPPSASSGDPAEPQTQSGDPPAQTVAALYSIGGQSWSLNSVSALVAGTATLVPGGPAITISNTPISLVSSANVVVVGSLTKSLVAVAAAPTPTPAPQVQAFTLDGSIYTLDSSSALVIGTQTLTPGGRITVSGTPISLAPSASYILVGTSTIPLSLPTAGAGAGEGGVFTLAGSTYSLNAASDLVIGTQTLTPGGAAITVSGTPVSLGVGASDLVVGGTSTQGLGGLIMSGFGEAAGGRSTLATQTIVPFEGKARRGGAVWWVSVLGFTASVVVMGNWW